MERKRVCVWKMNDKQGRERLGGKDEKTMKGGEQWERRTWSEAEAERWGWEGAGGERISGVEQGRDGKMAEGSREHRGEGTSERDGSVIQLGETIGSRLTTVRRGQPHTAPWEPPEGQRRRGRKRERERERRSGSCGCRYSATGEQRGRKCDGWRDKRQQRE